MRSKLKISIFCICLILGTAQTLMAVDVGPPNYGRYQISSWSARVDENTTAVGAFVIDTATGESKTVYTRLLDKNGQGRVIKNDLKKPFHAIE